MRTLIAFIVSVALFIGSLSAQPTDVSKRGTTAAPFLSIGQGARAIGMGGAFVAIADDPSAMYWNPAGIADLAGISVIAEHTNWLADIQYEYLGATVSTGSFGTLGLNVTVSNVGDMKVTTVDQQDGTGEVFGVTDLAVGISYGLKLTDNFAIGFNPKIIYQQIWKMSASAYAIDLGVKYRTPFEGVTLGMSVSNFGSKMQLQGENALVLFDPDPTTTGNNGHVPAYLSTNAWDLPLNFRVGVAYDVPIGELGKMSVAADAMHPSDDYESVNVGAEYLFQDFLYLRAGRKSLFQQNSEEGITFGLGVKQYLVGNVQFSVDYAYQDFGRLKYVQKLGIGVKF
ncbi:MAG TPA: PorV/PorQ family protein [Bacteroidota bacterium]